MPSNSELGGWERLRYKRHLMLPQVGEEGQRKLGDSRVLVVGAGGLGSPICMYLAAAGVGALGIADYDVVDETNLQRQILYDEADVGRPKAEAAAGRIRRMNSRIQVQAIKEGLTQDNGEGLISRYDIVVDATDNFDARYLLSDICVKCKKPEVYGAIYEFSGQAAILGAGGPCLRCLSPGPPKEKEAPDSKKAGVLGVLPGIVGCIQAAETLKWILGIGNHLTGRMIFVNALTMEFEEMELPRNPKCPVCGSSASESR